MKNVESRIVNKIKIQKLNKILSPLVRFYFSKDFVSKKKKKEKQKFKSCSMIVFIP